MIDYAGNIYHMIDGEQVQFGSKYIFCTRHESDKLIGRAIATFCRRFAGNLTAAGLSADKLTVAEYRAGNLYSNLPGFPLTIQCQIRQIANKMSDRLAVAHSRTASRVMVIGDDGYSRAVGGGFSAVPDAA